MSVCFEIYNRTKRQMLSPDMGKHPTMSGHGQAHGMFSPSGNSVSVLLALLMCPYHLGRVNDCLSEDAQRFEPWVGDDVEVVADSCHELHELSDCENITVPLFEALLRSQS